MVKTNIISTKNRTNIALLIILIIALIIRLILFQGIGTSDSLSSTLYAYDILNDNFPTSQNQGNSRIGLLLPVSYLYSILGVNEFSSGIFPLIISLLGIILIFLFGRLLFNEKVGLIAAFLLSIFPLDILYATRLMSDLPSAVFSALSVYLFLKAEKIKKNKRKFALYAFSGMSLGISLSMREMAVLTFLFFAGYVIYTKKIKISYGIVAAGFLTILILELSFFYTHTGDPFYRYNSFDEYYMMSLEALKSYGRSTSLPHYFLAFPFVMFANIQLGYFYTFISLAVIYFLYNRKWKTNILIMWAAVIYLYLNFGSTSFSVYTPFSGVARYLSYITFPSILLLAAFLMEEKDTIRKIILPFTLIFLFIASFGAVYLDDFRHGLDDLHTLYDSHIKSLDKPIYSDYRTISAINFISGYKNDLNMIDLDSNPKNIRNIQNAHIIINYKMIKGMRDAKKDFKFTSEIKQVPSSWVKTKEIGKDKNKIIVYFVS